MSNEAGQQKPRYYTVEDLAEILDKTPETIRIWLNDKKDPIPHYRVRREYRVLVEDFEKWMASHKVGDDK